MNQKCHSFSPLMLCLCLFSRQWLRKDGSKSSVVVPEGFPKARESHTAWRLIEASQQHDIDGQRTGWPDLVEFNAITGRPHQLRLAAAKGLGSPLCGDLRYGGLEPLPDRSIALHARTLDIPHPTLSRYRLVITAPPPDSLRWSVDGSLLDVWGSPCCVAARKAGCNISWSNGIE